MDNRFFEKVAPEVAYLAPMIYPMAFYLYIDGRRLRTWVQGLLRAIGQRLRPGLPSQSTVAGEPGPSDDTTQHGSGHEWWRYYTPFGPAGMYGPGSRWGASIR